MTINPHHLIAANAEAIEKAKAVAHHAYALETANRNWQLIQKSAERGDVYSDGRKCRITSIMRRRSLDEISEQEAKLIAALNALSL